MHLRYISKWRKAHMVFGYDNVISFFFSFLEFMEKGWKNNYFSSFGFSSLPYEALNADFETADATVK